MSPSSATRQTALSVSRSDGRTSFTASFSVSRNMATRLSTPGAVGLALGLFALGLADLGEVGAAAGHRFQRPCPGTCAMAGIQNSSMGSVSSSTSTPRAAKPSSCAALLSASTSSPVR